MRKIVRTVLELIGETPLVELQRIVPAGAATVYAKLESLNPGGSVKDRISLAMIEEAEEHGLLTPGATVIEPTSGNTGIGLAMVCAVKGYKLILTMPDTMSAERLYILKSYGAEVVLTSGSEGMIGAVKKAEALLAHTPQAFMPQQFMNPANPRVHQRTTAQEIVRATDGQVDAFVAGVGTGGTITGVSEVLKKRLPQLLVVAVEPATSAVLSGDAPGPHLIQGIGAGFVPPVLKRELINRIIKVKDEDAYRTARELAHREGLFVGLSAGAACWAALQIAQELGQSKRLVVIFPDSGERYATAEPYFSDV